MGNSVSGERFGNKSNQKQIVIGVVLVIVIVIVVIITIAGVPYLFAGMCGSNSYKSILSPTGEYKAVIFEFSCGETTGFATHVSILGASEKLDNEHGNIFVSKGHPKSVAPEVTWISDFHLNIHKQIKVKVYKQVKSWGWPWKKIKVSYK